MALTVANGFPSTKFIDQINVSDPEYVKQLLRPPDIKEDVKLMEERRRVSLILRSAAFRKELEKTVASQMKQGQLSANVLALKQIVDLLTPHTRLGTSNFSKCATIPVVPINDLRSAEGHMYPKAERLIRCKLASVYRLVDLCGWNTGINNHVTVRISQDANEFLINPSGLLYHELTAASLVKVDSQGQIIDHGVMNLPIDRPGWMLHMSVYSARNDIRCIVHLSTPATVAVSCTNTGLLPVSQEAMIIGSAAFYDPSEAAASFEQTADEDASSRRQRRETHEYEAIARALASAGDQCSVLIVRNHGALAMGKSVEEAWFLAFAVVIACEAQLRLANVDTNELVLPSKEAQAAAHYVGRTPSTVHMLAGGAKVAWRLGELEFEAAMRRLDAAGYRTGYIYRLTQVRQSATGASMEPVPDGDHVDAAAHARRAMSLGRRGKDSVEIPPSVSSFATAYYGDDESRALAAAEAKAKTLSLSRMHWTNTPNVYLREDIEEIGTSNPKKLTHWSELTDADKRHTCGMAVAISNPNQFALQGSNPHEFKLQQKKVKDNYYKDTKTAGPRSRLLEGLDLEDEVDSSKPSSLPPTSPRGTLLRYDPSSPPILEPGHVVVVGAASRGIINRDQRHNAGLFQSVFSPNPFDRVTDDDLERYKENVERKAKGLPSLEEEEEEARREEARRAAEVARQVMEAAARQSAQQQQLHQQQLDVEKAATKQVRSDTSGAEASHDDTEKEAKKDEAQAPEKKKKRRFKLPSFARKQKDK